MSDLRYDETAHAYYRADVRLPSVTGIINETMPRKDGAPEDAIEKARLRGEWVDKAFTEYLMTGRFECSDPRPQEWDDCFGQACDWWDRERAGSKVECQVRVFGKREAGTLDLLVNSHEIIDLKCTWEISKTVPAQLGGYSEILEESKRYTTNLSVLHCHRRLKEAKYKEFDYEESRRQWRVIRDFYWLINSK